MPTVRRSERQIAPAPLPRARRTDDPGSVAAAQANVGRALAGVGNVVADLGVRAVNITLEQRLREEREARRRADVLAIQAYDNQLAAWERDQVYNPEGGALTKKGKEAFDLPEKVDADFQTFADEQAQVLITPEQKEAAFRIKSERQQRLALAIRRHVDQQIQSYTAQELDAKIDNTIDSALRNALEPKLIAKDLAAGEAAIAELGSFLGLGDEAIEGKKQELRSAIHVGVVERLLAEQQTRAAKAYFDEAKGQIAADKIDDVTRALRAGSVKAEAQAAADKILAEGGTLTQQRDKAKAIGDPDVRDAVLSYIEHEQIVRDRAEQDAKEALDRQVYDILDAGKGIKGIPANLWGRLSGGQRSAARHYAEALAGGTGGAATDQKALYGLMQQAMNDPRTFSRMNLLDFRAKLSRADFEQMARLQLSMRQGEQSDVDQQLTSFATPLQMYQRTAESLGIDDKSEEGLALWKRFQQLGLAEERARGKKLSDDELQKVLDRLVLSVTTKRGGWLNIFPGGEPFRDQTKRGFEMTINDVPQSERALILDALKRGGITNPSADDILGLYLRRVEQAK